LARSKRKDTALLSRVGQQFDNGQNTSALVPIFLIVAIDQVMSRALLYLKGRRRWLGTPFWQRAIFEFR